MYSRGLPNPDLKWEQTYSRNLGFDFGFLKQRIVITTDLYLNSINNLLLQANVPTFKGFTNKMINAGSTQNKGLEISVHTANIQKKNFSWTTDFNIGFNRNKVTSLVNGTDIPAYSAWGGQNFTSSDFIVREGEPLGQMYGFVSDGLYQTSDFDYNATTGKYTLKPKGVIYDGDKKAQPGFMKYKDLNNDSIINDLDRTVIGNAYPKFTGGLTNTINYQNLDFTVFINWVFGNKIYNANKLYNTQTHYAYRSNFADYADRWRTIDPETGLRVTDPAILTTMNAGVTHPVYSNSVSGVRFYDKMVEDGSFLRISNISLGYTLPKKIISFAKLTSLRAYVTASNIYTFTKYSGYDPEVSTRNTTGLTPGVDFGSYPRPRTVVFGLNIAL